VDLRVEGRRGRPFTERTAWVRSLAGPIREFVATENASAGVLLAATVAALLWVNSPWGSTYERVWSAELSLRLAGAELSLSLREWVNDGLMAFFFFVVGSRSGASSTWGSCASAGGSPPRCWRRSAGWSLRR
jgi:hypothetical protein